MVLQLSSEAAIARLEEVSKELRQARDGLFGLLSAAAKPDGLAALP